MALGLYLLSGLFLCVGCINGDFDTTDSQSDYKSVKKELIGTEDNNNQRIGSEYLTDNDSQRMSDDLSSLRLLHLLYRHGDRTPCNPYPTDPYKDPSNWPVGFGQLTSRGKMMHFKLGQWIRERYSGFLSPEYNENEIIVRSTNVDRTLMSAQANLAGMFPPSGYMKWDKDLNWQPIPVHTQPRDEDNLLTDRADCPKLAHLRQELDDSLEMEQLYRDNIELFQYISKHSGREMRSVTDLDYIYDTLLVESIYNKTLPEWTNSIFPGGKFSDLRDISFIMNTFTHEMKRLTGGPFVSMLASHWNQVVEGELDPRDRKVFMFSGHDSTISTVLNTLNIFDGLAPPYASLVMFELHHNEDSNDWSVRILYKNETSSPPYPLILPGCKDPCPLSHFLEVTESVRPDENWVRECQIDRLQHQDDDSVKHVNVISLLIISLTVISVLLSITLIFVISQNRRMRRGKYERI